MSLRGKVLIGVIGLIAPAACSRTETPAPPVAATAPPTTAPMPSGTGTVHILGHVRFHGSAPSDVERPSKMAFPECSRFGPADSSLKLGPDGGVADAFVWVTAGLPGCAYQAPTTPVVLDQEGCEFRPRVFGVQVGQPVEIRNSDPFLHNTHAFAGGFNVPLPTKGAKVTRTFAKEEVPAVIGCDVHGWMRAYAGVVSSPFYAVTDANGGFEIAGLPAGHYTLGVWHERLGRQEADINLAGGEIGVVEIEMKVKK